MEWSLCNSIRFLSAQCLKEKYLYNMCLWSSLQVAYLNPFVKKGDGVGKNVGKTGYKKSPELFSELFLKNYTI